MGVPLTHKLDIQDVNRLPLLPYAEALTSLSIVGNEDKFYIRNLSQFTNLRRFRTVGIWEYEPMVRLPHLEYLCIEDEDVRSWTAVDFPSPKQFVCTM